ncbi:MAG: RHS repeat-associated core domain-containing protein [Cyclobacteriaceae bacterium]|nr:MAG: RHS repeat-associated core domain-containing protein [Cyclobacteriaceae bacterium]
MQTLDFKHYELTNHLGNVLSVVTDNINISPDSAFAKIVAATDYYAFGSEMPGRTYSGGGEEGAGAYRYGFNGKEKDTENTWGDTSYDYGFRIYNPRYGKFLSVDPLTKSYPMLTPYQFASNRPIDGIDLDGLEYVRRVHIVAGNGAIIHTEDYVYYKMSENELAAHGGTPAGRYNAGGHGPRGEGVLHQFINASGELLKERWDLERNSAVASAQTHGLYSGGGSITQQGNGFDYDFSWQPIDIADAIAKAHDIEYSEAVKIGGPSQGYVEDVRTLQADIKMVERVNRALKGETAEKLGIETPWRTGKMSGETIAALQGQKTFIGMLALWKNWKSNQQNQGSNITIFNDGDTQKFINDVSGNKLQREAEKIYRKGVVAILREAERARTKQGE